MAWDSSRVVPWRRLIREWLIYVGIAAAAITIYSLASDKKLEVGIFTGLLASGPMYVGMGALLAKFGYQRKTMKQLRAERAAAPASATAGSRGASATATSRNRPAPTKRTSTGPSQHRKPKRR